MSTDYDICIVGAGMIGSAAARHVTEMNPHSKVCVIGPEEPKERSLNDNRTIYGAHYDQGRVTRQTSKDEVWSVLAKRSISRYRDLERQAGIAFYEDVGCLTVAPKTDPVSVDSARTVTDTEGPATIANWSEIKSKYNLGYFKFGNNDQAILEHGGSGHINPRLLVEAELLVSRKRGCDVMRDVVCDITEFNFEGAEILQIQTYLGRKFLAKKVLLATGSFTSCNKLLPEGIRPNLGSASVHVVLAEVSEGDRRNF